MTSRSAKVPSTEVSPASRVLAELLSRTATRAGFRAARVFVADDRDPPPCGVTAVRDGDRLMQSAVAADEPIHLAAQQLSEIGLGAATAIALRLSDATVSPMRVLVLFDRITAVDVAPAAQLIADRPLLDAAVMAVLDADDQRRRHRELDSARRFAEGHAAVEERLDAADDSAETIASLIRICSELTGKPVALFDQRGRTVAAAAQYTAGRIRMPSLDSILRGRDGLEPEGTGPAIIPAGSATGLTRRKLLMSIVGRGHLFGWLVIDEHPSPFRVLDQYTATRTARRLTAQFVVQQRIARVAWNARSSLTRQLVRGTGAAEDLAASGEYLGINTSARRVLVYVRAITTDVGGFERTFAECVERALDAEVLSTRGSDGILLLVEASDTVAAATTVASIKAALNRAATQLCPLPGLIAGLSGVCEPSNFARAYREAREVVQCIDRFTERTRHRILAVDDLGPARLFLANGEVSAIHQFVKDTLGPLLDGDKVTTELLRTLECWFDCGRSVRGSASRLGIHENTVRLRLARIHTLTGLDVGGSPSDQLSIQTGLLVLRLQGHPALYPPEQKELTAVTGLVTVVPVTTDERRTA